MSDVPDFLKEVICQGRGWGGKAGRWYREAVTQTQKPQGETTFLEGLISSLTTLFKPRFTWKQYLQTRKRRIWGMT